MQDQDQERPGNRGDNITHRDRDSIEVGKQAEQAEYEAADNRAGQPKDEICLEAETAFLAFDDKASDGSAQEADDQPDGKLVKRDVHDLSRDAVPTTVS